MTLDNIPQEEVEKVDLRNSKKRYLVTDRICTKCCAINNIYYENHCVICRCGSEEFISGRISKDIRILLNFGVDELRMIAELEGVSGSTKIVITRNLIRKIYPNHIHINKVSHDLIRKIMRRSKKKCWYLKEI